MAIQDNGTRDQYTATSGQTIFPYTFEIFDKDDVAVEQNSTLLTEGTHYTVSGVGVDAGGNITLVTGATTGDILTIYRSMALERLTDYQNNGDFLSSDVNDDFDRIWAALQQNKNGADLAIRANTNDTILNSTNTTLADIATRKNKSLGFDSTGAITYLSGAMPVGTLRNYATMAALQADVANTVIGDRVYLDERSSGNGGGAWWKVVDETTVVENGFNIVTGDATRSFQLIFNGSVNIKEFGAKGDGSTDDTLSIQAALDYARALVLVTVTTITDVDFGNKGGIEVFAPAGTYIISQIEVPETVSLVGAGKNSTLFSSVIDDAIIRNKVTTGTGTFDKVGVRLADFSVTGDRTKSSQVGIDTLRLFDCLIENVTVLKSGGDGIKLRQALTTTLRNSTTSNCVGDGIVLDEGINFWATPTLTNLPSNANSIINCHSFFNDGAGLRIKGLANGNLIQGGSYEQNYLAAGDNSGYNIHDTATTFSENVLQDVWVEGPAAAHIYVNKATSSSPLRISGLKHFGATTTNRAVIVDKGTCYIERAYGHGTTYPTINSSNKPFRINIGAAVAVLKIENCEGSTITGGNFVEDENGVATSVPNQRTFNRFITGIDFDNTIASTDVNILDAYQEGSWTPTLTTTGTNFTDVTYDSLNAGTYVKIGKVVHIQGTLRTDSVTVGSATGSVVVGGLPYVASGESSSFVISTSSAWTTNHPSAGYVLSTGTTINLVYRATSNGATSTTAVADVATGVNSNLIRFSGTYIASS